VAGGGEAGHVHADLGDDDGRGHRVDAGNLIQPFLRLDERGDLSLDFGVQNRDIGVDRIYPGPS
jgi:hypothetical protein